MRVLLAELELISHGATASWNPAGGGTGPTSTMPVGEANPPHMRLRDEYLAATTLDDRAAVVRQMREELRRARRGVDRSHVVGETRDQEDERILTEGEGFPAGEVARHFNTTPTRVRRLRVANERDADAGRRSAATSCTAPATPAEAQRLKRAGATERQSALALGRAQSTINGWLKAAA